MHTIHNTHTHTHTFRPKTPEVAMGKLKSTARPVPRQSSDHTGGRGLGRCVA
jgi:hypothetical protein